jgi:hypothetical protein
MIEMAVAEDQSVDLLHIDTHDAHVVDEHVGGVPVVEHQRAGLIAALGFEPQRQSPLRVDYVGDPADPGVRCTLTPLTVAGRRKRLCVESTSTPIESLSTTGTSIAVAAAKSSGCGASNTRPPEWQGLLAGGPCPQACP